MRLTKPQHHIEAKSYGYSNDNKDNKDFNFNTHFSLTLYLLLRIKCTLTNISYHSKDYR